MSTPLESVADPGIPTLSAVLDGVEFVRVLDELGLVPGTEPRDLEVRVLRHHEGKRCVFEAAWRGPQWAGSCIGKVYAEDRADVHRAMCRIARAGFSRDADLSIPEPIAYVPELRLHVQESVPGRSVTELFLSGDPSDHRTGAERCGEWLARLHTLGPRTAPMLDLVAYRSSIDRWARRIAEASARDTSERAACLRDRLQAAMASLVDVGGCASHGSFTHHQVITGRRRTVAFDWDDHVVADPAFDVARFVVGLRRLALRMLPSIRALDHAAEAFLESYRSARLAHVHENFAFYGAAICLRLAKKDVRRKAEGWAEKAASTLDEGLRILERGV